jgi:cytochrome c-type biogenesis protein CcmH/NrfF
MNPRPWQVSAIVFLVLTLLYWSNLQVNVTLKGFPIQAYFPQSQGSNTALASHSIAGDQGSTYIPPTGPFPKVDTKKNPKTNLTAILLSNDAKKLQNDIIPKENTTSPYGLKFNLTTFNQEKKWSTDIKEDPAWKDRYDAITKSTYHPCCGATIDTNDCGHAIALTGLVKKMLQDGKSDQEIKDELMQWEEYYFPRHYVIVALALKRMDKPLANIDLSENYSSIGVETSAGNYLIYN